MENRVYVENKDNFWRDLLVRIALILLFIFLLVWLFPMPKLETFYDRIFADNIKMMQEASKDYFTIERLPKEIGDKKKITLREMVDKKMILPFLDRDGNTCDFDNSYVEVIRMEKDYVFKTNLSCPTKTDYVINYLGCYDVCEDEACVKEQEKTALEYQYSRSISKNVIDKYSCPTGYIVRGSSCVKESSIIDRIAANLSCNAGFTYNKNTDSCEKTVSNTTNAEKVCQSGYTYSANSDSCLKYIVNDQAPVPVCSTGTYNASTGKCVIGNTSTYNATLVCDSGTYNPSTGKCVVTGSSTYNASPVCSTGTYNASTGKCVISSSSTYGASPVCSTGTYNASTGKCIVPTSSTYGASLVCKQGTDNGSSCTITPATTIAATPHTSYSTTTVYLTATITKKWSCTVREYQVTQPYQETSTFTRKPLGSEVRYSCAAKTPSCLIIVYKYEECTAVNYGTCSDSSYTYSNSLAKCTKQVTTSTTTYSCSNGATPSGDRCPVAAVTVAKVYSCPSGGTLSGSTCYVSGSTSVNPSYTCPSGGSLSGTTCTVSSSSSVNPSYTCPSGGSLSGTICTISSSTTVNPRYTCPNGGSLSGNMCYVSGSSTQNPTWSCRLGTLVGNVCKITTIDNKPYSYNCSTGTLSGNKCLSSAVLREAVSYNCNEGYTRTGTECVKTISSSSVIDGTPSYKSISSTEYKWSTEISLNGWTRTGKTREIKLAINQEVYTK